jgi:hypothetical protein
LPIFGTFLVMPPIALLFATDATVAGVPLVVAYLFGVWLALIGCAAWLARRMKPPSPDDTPGPNGG